jgi:hypothetical protein
MPPDSIYEFLRGHKYSICSSEIVNSARKYGAAIKMIFKESVYLIMLKEKMELFLQ